MTKYYIQWVVITILLILVYVTPAWAITIVQGMRPEYTGENINAFMDGDVTIFFDNQHFALKDITYTSVSGAWEVELSTYMLNKIDQRMVSSIWFLYDTASGDIGGYDTLFPDPSVGVVQSYNIAIPANPTLIEEFATEIGEPGLTFIQNGVLTFHFDARRSAGVKNCRVYAEIYSRTHPGAAETLICTTEESHYLTNVQMPYEIHAICPETSLAATDRLVVKVYGNQYDAGANPTIQFYVEGVTNTRIELPAVGAGSAFANVIATAVVKGADPTVVLLEAGGGECGRDFLVFVTVKDVWGCSVWQALSSPMPVADMITYYWSADPATGNVSAYICNDSQRDVQAIIWWSR